MICIFFLPYIKCRMSIIKYTIFYILRECIRYIIFYCIEKQLSNGIDLEFEICSLSKSLSKNAARSYAAAERHSVSWADQMLLLAFPESRISEARAYSKQS